MILRQLHLNMVGRKLAIYTILTIVRLNMVLRQLRLIMVGRKLAIYTILTIVRLYMVSRQCQSSLFLQECKHSAAFKGVVV
jgi:hypothetical protein